MKESSSDFTTGYQETLLATRIMGLIERAKAGDSEAWSSLFTVFEPMMRSALSSFLADTDLYSELRGDAFLAFYRLTVQFDGERGVNIFTYFKRTLKLAIWTAAKRYLRTMRREYNVSNIDYFDSLFGGRADLLVMDRLVIAEAIDKLSCGQRAVVKLRMCGFTFEEIAAKLSVSPDACRQRYQRATDRLRQQLENVY